MSSSSEEDQHPYGNFEQREDHKSPSSPLYHVTTSNSEHTDMLHNKKPLQPMPDPIQEESGDERYRHLLPGGKR